MSNIMIETLTCRFSDNNGCNVTMLIRSNIRQGRSVDYDLILRQKTYENRYREFKRDCVRKDEHEISIQHSSQKGLSLHGEFMLLLSDCSQGRSN